MERVDLGAEPTAPRLSNVVRAVVLKELADLRRNRTLIVSLLAPVFLALVFVHVMERVRHSGIVRVTVLRGSDEKTRALLTLTGAFDVSEVADTREARERVETRTVDLALILPRDFDERLGSEAQPQVSVLVRRDSPPHVAAAVAALTEMLRVRAGQRSPVSLSLEPVGPEAAGAMRAQWVMGFIVFELLMGFGIAATSLVEERERGTMRAIRVTGASPAGVLLGKAIVVWGLSLAAAVATIGLCGLLHPPLSGVLVVMAAGSAFAVAFGLWMGGLFPNLAAANAGLPVVFMLVFLPTVLGSQAARPAWVRLTPGHWLVEGLQQTLVESGGLESAWKATGLLVACALLCACASWVTLARRPERE